MFDVAVIGAGVSGAAIARRLAACSVSVAPVEKAAAGSSAAAVSRGKNS